MKTLKQHRIIDLQMPVEYFDRDRWNELEACLALFKLKKGDCIRFHEWDIAKQRYTGRFYDREVQNFHRIRRATRFWRKSDLRRHGFYVLQLKEPRRAYRARHTRRVVRNIL